ncbi:MAG: pre-peptidase C-terminal domain-containing protein [Gammaproteobacteria bacterium]
MVPSPLTRLLAAFALLLLAGTASAQGGIDFGDDSGEWVRDGECDDPRFAGEGVADYLVDADLYRDATDCRKLLNEGRIRFVGGGDAGSIADGGVHRDRLAAGDATLTSGEYMDEFTFEGRSGQEAVIDLRSSDFDPYLIVSTPSGEQFDNDDYEGDTSRSLISLVLEESGTYEVLVTSYEAGESGGYTLQMDVGEAVELAGLREETGTLGRGDSTLDDGEYLDVYEFSGRPGQRVTIDLRSNDFDTYLILEVPNGDQQENDDAEDTTDSLLVSDITESGTYRIGVTSYEPGESGAYRLTIDQVDASGGQPRQNRDVETLTVGRATTGELESGDLTLDTGEYQDTYFFEGRAGQSVSVEMTSSDFDTYVGLVTPAGDVIENDDFEGSTSRSVVELNLTETGRYRVMATSYTHAEIGRYRLTVNTQAASSTPVGETFAGGSRSGGRTYGLFAGISDYPGTGNDLDFTADDALRVRDALIRGGGMLPEDAITLTDADATTANMARALADIGSRAGPDDTFVFFYSGHGGREIRPSGPEMSDPDALDETLVLYDDSIRDDELRELFEQIRAGTTLLFLDSCFSGGFAKDVISVPGRMGMFSSEEDVTSQVAVKFRAGGYLSIFLDEAIGDGLADEDRDGAVTAIELSEYVHYRYRNDVKSADPDDFVRTGGRQSGYQHLVVDRGSVGPYDVLFTYSL